jgi:hypothetical protein
MEMDGCVKEFKYLDFPLLFCDEEDLIHMN